MTKMNLPSDANASGRSFGEEERKELMQVLESGTLNCTRGRTVIAFEKEFATMHGVPHARCVTSGTAAVHTAINAIDPEPGDEIVTTPITDMGALTPIVYQSAIPVFADTDPVTMNVTAETIEPCLSERTKAVIVTHLFGNPCEMGPILELCQARGIPVIEDAAQAFLSEIDGKKVGTMGEIGCFSFQQGKHMTTGEGGVVITKDDALFRRMKLFSDKAWPYGEANPDHEFLALNYRMTELQGAVALGQLHKLEENVAQRIRTAERLTKALEGIPGLILPKAPKGGRHTYWRYPLMVDEAKVKGGPDLLGAKLKEQGVYCGPRYIVKPAFECKIFKDKVTFGKSGFPFRGPHMEGRKEVVYDRARTPGVIEALSRVIVIPWNENIQDKHVDWIAQMIKNTVAELSSVGEAQ